MTPEETFTRLEPAPLCARRSEKQLLIPPRTAPSDARSRGGLPAPPPFRTCWGDPFGVTGARRPVPEPPATCSSSLGRRPSPRCRRKFSAAAASAGQGPSWPAFPAAQAHRHPHPGSPRRRSERPVAPFLPPGDARRVRRRRESTACRSCVYRCLLNAFSNLQLRYDVRTGKHTSRPCRLNPHTHQTRRHQRLDRVTRLPVSPEGPARPPAAPGVPRNHVSRYGPLSPASCCVSVAGRHTPLRLTPSARPT